MTAATPERRFEVLLHRSGKNPTSVRLMVARTADEVEALRKKGHRLTTYEVEAPFDPPAPPEVPKASGPPNERRPNHYSRALAAVVDLMRYAEGKRNDDLRDRAADALRALLRGQATLTGETSPGIGASE
jgi:hypothetical protein